MEQYLALSRENQAPSVVKLEIRGNVNFEIKSQFMQELREDTFSGNKKEDAHDHIDQVLNIVDRLTPGVVNTWDLIKKAFIQRYCPPSKTAKQLEDIHKFKQESDESLYQAWERYNDLLYKCPTHDINSHQKHDGTSSRNISSSSNTDGLVAVIRPHLDKECPLNEEVKQVDEVKYGELGSPAPFNGSNGAKFRVGPPGYYTRTDSRPPYGEKRPSLEELMNKHEEESARRSTEMKEWIKKLQENAEINTRNQSASLKT
ncbi:zinc knuckle CX2CX4HX4C containing protein [Tanacetum coccineum]